MCRIHTFLSWRLKNETSLLSFFKQWHVSRYRARGNFSIQLMMKYSKIDLTSDVLASSHNIYCLQNRVKHILKLSSSSVYCSTRTAQRGSPGDTTARRSELNSNLCCSILGAAPTVCSGGGEWQLGLMIIALTIAMIILLLFLLTAESPHFCSPLPLLVWWRFILIWKDHQLDKERSARLRTCADLCGREIEHGERRLLARACTHTHTHVHTVSGLCLQTKTQQ